jgi:uncharacterized protein (TIGR02145 family)
MKEAGTTHWQTPNTGATNSSGFTAVPGGFRYRSGDFYMVGYSGGWWSSSSSSLFGPNTAWFRSLLYNHPGNDRSSFVMGSGFSVRCIKD